MDFVFEVLFDIILDGCTDIVKEKKIPLFIRILCAAILAIFYIGIVGLLLCIGISNQNIIIFLIAVLAALFIILGSVSKLKKIRKRRK